MNRTDGAQKNGYFHMSQSAFDFRQQKQRTGHLARPLCSFALIFHVVELKIPALEMNDIYSNAAGYF